MFTCDNARPAQNARSKVRRLVGGVECTHLFIASIPASRLSKKPLTAASIERRAQGNVGCERLGKLANNISIRRQ